EFRRVLFRSSVPEQGVHVLLGLKRAQILHRLADADIANRYAELLGDGEYHTTGRGAVELGDGDAGQTDGVVEGDGLLQGVAAGGGVDHEHDRVRGVTALLAEP